MSELVFDEESHKYYLNGVQLPGVTSILKSVGLVDYSGIPIQVIEQASDRGKRVHKITEFYDAGTLDESSIPDELGGYAGAWVDYMEASQAVICEIELRVKSKKLRFAGTLDRVALIDDRLAIVDIKTTSQSHPGHAVQTMAYSMAYSEMSGNKIQDRYCVYLRSDGTYTVVKHSSPANDRLDKSIWLSALAVYGYSKKEK